MLTILFDKKNSPNCIYGGKNDDLKTLSTFVANPAENNIKIYDGNSKKNFMKFKLVS